MPFSPDIQQELGGYYMTAEYLKEGRLMIRDY